jgi:hypothetical protein
MLSITKTCRGLDVPRESNDAKKTEISESAIRESSDLYEVGTHNCGVRSLR